MQQITKGKKNTKTYKKIHSKFFKNSITFLKKSQAFEAMLRAWNV